MKYASKTSVPVDRSMGQIRQLLAKNGADGVAIAETHQGASTHFIFEGKPYKFSIFYPDQRDDSIKYTDSGRERTLHQIESEIDAEKRRLWRCLVLYIKASIEAHNNGVIDIKRSMMSHMVLPSGKTIYQQLEGNLGKIESNPSLLLG